MALAKLDLQDRNWTDAGLLNAGGFIATYEANSSTPLASYSDADGTQNDNPIELDSSGVAHIWLTRGTAYKLVFMDANQVPFYTEDDVVIASDGTAAGSQYVDVALTYLGGPPTSSQWLGGDRFTRATAFLANFNGSYGKVPKTLPASSFVVTIKKNDSAIGTATCNTSGVWTFASTAGAAYSFAAGDEIDFYAPASADTNMANFGLTLAGALA